MCEHLFYEHPALPGGRILHVHECRHPKTPDGVCPYPAMGSSQGSDNCPLGRDNNVEVFRQQFGARR